ncbi:MAG: YdcF family protein [Clostridia bacterium]|nr:YdcF family protein [Clostridia bacterium]
MKKDLEKIPENEAVPNPDEIEEFEEMYNMSAVRTVKFILYFISAVCLIYGGYVLCALKLSHWFNFAFLIVGVALALFAFFLERFMFFSPAVKAIFYCAVGILLINFIVFEIAAISHDYKPQNGAEWIVLLGAKVDGEKPSAEFMSRIKATADYAKKNPDAKIIVCGGKGKDENISEADAAKNELILLGIEKERILTDDKSDNTKKNLKNAKAIIENMGSSVSTKVAIVSSRYHLFRADKYSNSLGYSNVTYCGATGFLPLVPFNYCREYAAYVRLLFDL